MIGFVPEYYGWLGNQMFQYACVKALSLREGVECSFPEKEPNLHNIFNLNCLNTFNVPSDNRIVMYHEPSFEYREIPSNIPKNLILKGYFQSEKYFKDFENEIREEFTFKNQSTYKVPSGSCSIHVRRGDYLKLQSHHPLCDMDYYSKAMSVIKADNYLIFSDDPSWCFDNFKGDQYTVISGNSPAEDMQLMSECDNNIIANSSFSWWGAWLNSKLEKKVIAPKKWFGSGSPHSAKDICCEGWNIL
jgi:hypothetical protein